MISTDIGYSVSSTGQVMNNKTNKILKPDINSKGYARAVLPSGKKLIHRLVALAFIPNPLNLPQVNHINGNKQDNNLSNLEWCTGDYNQAHAIQNGLATVIQGESHMNAKLSNANAFIIKQLSYKTSAKQLADRYGVSTITIHRIWENKVWKHIPYI